MNDTVFEIPILRDQIALYLTSKDIKNCILVSKQWSYWFIPSIWRNVTFKYSVDTSYQGLSESLSRYSQFIQSMTLDSLDIFETALPALPIMNSLVITGQVDSAGLLQFFNFDTTPLRKISIAGIYSKDQKNTSRLVDALKSAAHLNHLDLSFNDKVVSKVIQNVMINHGHIETLKISCTSGCTYLQLKKHIKPIQQAISRMQDPKIKHLSLQFYSSSQESAFVFPLLRRCTQLEKLHLSSSEDGTDLIELTKILKKGDHPRLNSLHIERNWSVNRDMDNLLQELANMYSQMEVDGVEQFKGIQELVLNSVNISEDFHRNLIRHFSNTLTSLYIDSISRIETIVTLLSGLPVLQKCIVSRCDPFTIVDVHDSTMLQILNSSWSCLDMRDFDITINLFYGMSGSNFYRDWKGSVNEKLGEYIFSQLGRLTKLRRLRIDADGCCLNVSYGYLEYLSDLKEMRTLDLTRYASKRTLPSPMEAEWMIDHWPKLNTIYFPRTLTNDLDPQNQAERKRIRNDASDLIREKRPDIVIKVQYGYGGEFFNIE